MAPEKLRFDFSHKAAVTDSELRKIEDISTQYIRYVGRGTNTMSSSLVYHPPFRAHANRLKAKRLRLRERSNTKNRA